MLSARMPCPMAAPSPCCCDAKTAPLPVGAISNLARVFGAGRSGICEYRGAQGVVLSLRQKARFRVDGTPYPCGHGHGDEISTRATTLTVSVALHTKAILSIESAKIKCRLCTMTRCVHPSLRRFPAKAYRRSAQ